MNKICRFCNKNIYYEKGRQFSAHARNCNDNPNKNKAIKKLSLTKRLKTKKKFFNIYCNKCDKYIPQLLTSNQFKYKRYRKCCSRKCANSHIMTDEIKNKISLKLKGRFIEFNNKNFQGYIIKKCVICKNNFKIRYSKRIRQTCFDKKCYKKLLSLKSIELKTGGYHSNTKNKYYGGYYKNIWFDSSWEIMVAKQLDKNNIKWIRNDSIKIPYIIDKLKRNYHPDFYLVEYDKYIEVKGWWKNSIKKMICVIKQNNLDIIPIDSKYKIKDVINQIKNGSKLSIKYLIKKLNIKR